jgi:hypothetical protein
VFWNLYCREKKFSNRKNNIFFCSLSSVWSAIFNKNFYFTTVSRTNPNFFEFVPVSGQNLRILSDPQPWSGINIEVNRYPQTIFDSCVPVCTIKLRMLHASNVLAARGIKGEWERGRGGRNCSFYNSLSRVALPDLHKAAISVNIPDELSCFQAQQCSLRPDLPLSHQAAQLQQRRYLFFLNSLLAF